jgi:hypothetical protein
MSTTNESTVESIGALVRRLEDDFVSGTTHKSEFVDESLYEDINKIEAYLNSKHVSGSTDSMGREKPFANICVGARNIWYRATEVGQKSVRIKATKAEDTTSQYIATAHIQDWMRRESFGLFLNTWGLNLATYNYGATKWVEQDGRLIPSNIPWTRIICDSIDFDNNPKIEILEFTEAQLRNNKAYDQDKVKDLCEANQTRKALDGTQKDNKTGYIRLYEVHGEFSLATLKQAKGEKCVASDYSTYVQQMHVVSFVAGKEKDTYDDYTIYAGREEDPYILTYLIPSTDGSINLNGAVKNLFEAQWMINHSVKSIKDQLDLASKILFQTSDGTFVGQNALFALEQGDILIHQPNQPLSQLNNASHDVASQQNFASMWRGLGNEINGISDAMQGEVKAGSAWRQTEALLQESHDLFNLMTQSKKLHMETFMRKKIIPFVKKKMDSSKEIAVTLADYGIDKLEAKFVKNQTIKGTNEELKKRILSGVLPTPEDQEMMMEEMGSEIKTSRSEMGEQRFLKPSEIDDRTWKEELKDFEWEVEVDIPGETSDVQEAMTTLNTIMTLLADPVRAQFFETEKGKFLLNKSLQLTGTVSPIELSELKAMPNQVQPMPGVGGASGGELAIK